MRLEKQEEIETGKGRALIRPNDHIDHVAVEEEVGSQTGAEPWVPSTPPSTSRATSDLN